MNYKRIYDELIAYAKNRNNVTGYKERHHIIPKSMGGSNDKNNLVNLTAREHFIAHMCLALIYGGTQWLAVKRMKGANHGYINGFLYAIAKEKGAKAIGDALRGKPNPKLSAAVKGKKKSESHCKAISSGKIGKKIPKLSIIQKGVKRPDYSARMIGVPRPDVSIAMKGKPWSEKRRLAHKKLNLIIESQYE